MENVPYIIFNRPGEPSGLAGEALSYSTIYPTPRTPSSLAWVQCMQAGLRPSPQRRQAVRPSALGHHNPTVCSLACRRRLQSALRTDQESFSIETHPLVLLEFCKSVKNFFDRVWLAAR